MSFDKSKFLKEFNIDESYLVKNKIEWSDLEERYIDYSTYRKS